jgi:MFS family permease
MTNAYGVYQDYYVRFFLTSYTPSTIGWIGSTQLFFQFSMGLLAGKLFDAGYFYHIVSVASVLYIFAYYMLSLAHEDAFYQVFLSQGVAAGIALGFLFLPAIGVVAHHFRRRRSFAMGIVVSGSSCGGLVFPVMLNKLIVAGGFAQATRGVAYLCTGMMVLAILLMRTRLPPPPKRKEVESKVPAVPLPTLKDLLKDAKYMIATAGYARFSPAVYQSHLMDVHRVFFNVIGIFTPIFYLQLYAITHGVDKDLAFYTITILNGASVVGISLHNGLVF